MSLSLGIGLGVTFLHGAGGSMPPSAPPVNTVAPVASGTGYVGYTLTTTDGTWTGMPAPTFTYQWQRNAVNIGGATASTYAIVLADEGVPVRCVVTATNTEGSASANSNAIEQWMPTDATGLARWWSLRDSTKVAIATGISELASTLDARTLVQGTASRQPAYLQPGIEAVDAAEFVVAAASRLENLTPSDLGRDASGASMGVVAQATGVGVMPQLIHSYSGSTVNGVRFALQLDELNFQVAARRLDGDALAQLTVSTIPAFGQPFFGLGFIDHSVAEAFGRVNGTQGADVPTGRGVGNTSDTDAEAERMGASTGSPIPIRFFGGRISEVTAWNRVLTLAERESWEGYCAWVYDLVTLLPIGHAYKTAPPTP